ncbi:hypothetical protein [Methylotenera sp.]|uniref:hypothetical protein n=2 Tax=Methylotenera sp. TaxID=2051956 RepID=UPI00273094E4|nr:hypothetical protein [Methylotenera sp.]MDP2231327.1 hypothetical protein [Methylotenera sp.]MDP3209926.1 hypothetical protein [Methylotenera sp.]
MQEIEEIRTAEYLLRASPETVYEWFKAQPQRTLESGYFFGNDVPEEIEKKLLGRNNEIIDIALAAWGTNSETTVALYHRWCARSVVTDWPPQSSTYPYAILALTLANVNAPAAPWWSNERIPTNDFDWLIEYGDDDLFRLMHANIALGFVLLRHCANKYGAYGRIDERRWLFALQALGYNKVLHRIDKTDDEGPDLTHSDIHKSFVQAATISPKTVNAAGVLGELFEELPAAATEGAYVSDEALAAAVLAWDVEIPVDDENNYSSFQYYHKCDALTLSERVQFHLLRHYCSYFHLDPDDPVRVRRLAAYSKSPLNGGKGWGNTGKGLDIESFQRYSERDGPAFMYANSFNKNIWCVKEASEFTDDNRIYPKFPYPEDRSWIYLNRQRCVEDAAAEELLKASDTSEKPDSAESETLTNIGKAREESFKYYDTLDAKIGNLKKWLIWGGIIVVVLLLFRS